MAITFTDENTSTVIVPAGNTTTTPFANISVADSVLNDPEIVTVTLSGNGEPQITGSLSDPTGAGTWNATTHTFTETAINTGSPTPATTILDRLVYTPPAVTAGNEVYVSSTVQVNGVFDNPYNYNLIYTPTPPSVSIETAGAPTINNTSLLQPVVSGGTIGPFGAVQVDDVDAYSTNDVLTITVTDGGAPTDADGLLSGTGLSKTGTGSYTLALPYELDQLKFTPTSVAAGASRITTFNLTVHDNVTGFTGTGTASVETIGPSPTPTAPLIAGTVGGQTVDAGNAIDPFRGVTISDGNANPSDSATITVAGGGSLAGVGLTAGTAGTYTIAAESPGALSTTLENLTYTAPTTAGTSDLTLTVTDSAVALTASDNKTTVTTMLPPPLPPSNFAISDETTGQQSTSNGEAYSGPVSGLNWQFIDITTDKLNITATTPNVFIHSGSGDDAITVAGVNGNNVLDGSTGSNFLVGGTGDDGFFVDDRGATADIWSTIANFHTGDNVTVWGITPADFAINEANGLGAVGYTGLTFQITAAGKPDANFTLAGYTTADLTNGKLAISFGTSPTVGGLAGSTYMLIQGT